MNLRKMPDQAMFATHTMTIVRLGNLTELLNMSQDLSGDFQHTFGKMHT